MTEIENNQNIEKDDSSLLDFFCKRSYLLFKVYSILLATIFCTMIPVTIIYDSNIDYKFGINQLIKYLVISIIQYLMALLVIQKEVKVNYTRKVIHISYFIIPQLLDIIFLKYEKNKFTEMWNIWIILFLLLMLSEHIRNKIHILNKMFKAVDRPEDQPYTLIWFSSQIISTLIVVIPFSVYFSKIDRIGLIFIPILINGLADGLAEPIGIAFGKHKYKTKACLSKREYERSYEGSFCVFIVSTIILLAYYNYMSINEYIFNVLTIPILTTLTEAFSPHTWDSPLIFFVVSSLLTISTLF